MSNPLRLTVTLALFGPLASGLFGQPPSQVDLCQLLSNLERWNGTVVSVRALMAANTVGLYGPKCARTTIGNLTFENTVALTDPHAVRLPIHTVSFSLDTESWNKMVAAWYRAAADHKTIRVTVVGMFETRIPLKTLVYGDLGSFMGFGNESKAPGQILVKEVRDWTVESYPVPEK